MKQTSRAIRVALLLGAFVLLGAILYPASTTAEYTYGNSGTGILQPNYFNGLTIGPIEQFSGGTNILNAWVKNNEGFTKVLTIRKQMFRCQEHAGHPFQPGIGQCQYYWEPESNNPRGSGKEVVENITLPPHGSVLLQARVDQYRNQSCGSLQLDFFLDKVNGVLPAVTHPFSGPWGASFANMVFDCPGPQAIQPSTPICASNSDCGSDGFAGGRFCQDNKVFQNFRTFTCNDSGTSSARCTNRFDLRLLQDCGSNHICSDGACVARPAPLPLCISHVAQRCVGNAVYWFDSCGSQQDLAQQCTTSQACQNATCMTVRCSSNSECGSSGNIDAPYCQDNQVYQNYRTFTCNNPGTTNSECTSVVTPRIKQICLSNQTCANGNCAAVSCNQSADCGTNSFVGDRFCQGNNVFQSYRTFTCNNPGTSSALCTNTVSQQLQQSCAGSQICSNSSCIIQTSMVTPSQQAGALSMQKSVRNLSAGNLAWVNSVAASPSDVVQFQLAIHNVSGHAVNSVTVRDILPANLYYKDSLTLDGAVSQGDMTFGLNIGSIGIGQTRTITYQAQVAPSQNFSFGTTTLSNSAAVSSTDAGFISPAPAIAYMVISKIAITGVTSIATGWTDSFLTDSFFLPLALGLLGVWLFTSGTFNIPMWAGIRKAKFMDSAIQRKLQKKIALIRKREAL